MANLPVMPQSPLCCDASLVLLDTFSNSTLLENKIYNQTLRFNHLLYISYKRIYYIIIISPLKYRYYIYYEFIYIYYELIFIYYELIIITT